MSLTNGIATRTKKITLPSPPLDADPQRQPAWPHVATLLAPEQIRARPKRPRRPTESKAMARIRRELALAGEGYTLRELRRMSIRAEVKPEAATEPPAALDVEPPATDDVTIDAEQFAVKLRNWQLPSHHDRLRAAGFTDPYAQTVGRGLQRGTIAEKTRRLLQCMAIALDWRNPTAHQAQVIRDLQAKAEALALI